MKPRLSLTFAIPLALGLSACGASGPVEAQDTSAPTSDVAAVSAAESVASGTFAGAGGHEVAGSARIERQSDGSHRLVLSGDFISDGAPDLRVWLTDAPATDADTVRNAARVDLGGLESTDGGQSYLIPDDVDIESLRSAVIWCRAFGVYFGGATLS